MPPPTAIERLAAPGVLIRHAHMPNTWTGRAGEDYLRRLRVLEPLAFPITPAAYRWEIRSAPAQGQGPS